MTEEKALDIVEKTINKLGDKITLLENENKKLLIENKRLETICNTRSCTELPNKKEMNIEIHEQYLDWRKTENGLCRKAFTLGFKQCFYWMKHFKKQN